jgi:hypothetical protein
MSIPRTLDRIRSRPVTSARSARPASLRLAAMSLAAVLAGCSSFRAAAPEGFAQYPRGASSGSPLRAASPDGILFTVRTEKNAPPADLGFWREALKTRMGQAGYRVTADTVCPMGGSEGALLKLAAPMGNQDYFYWIAFTLSPSRDRILVAEAAGESKRFLARQAEIAKAIAASGF